MIDSLPGGVAQDIETGEIFYYSWLPTSDDDVDIYTPPSQREQQQVQVQHQPIPVEANTNHVQDSDDLPLGIELPSKQKSPIQQRPTQKQERPASPLKKQAPQTETSKSPQRWTDQDSYWLKIWKDRFQHV